MDPFPRNSRNIGEQGWDLAQMHLHISIKGSRLSFYACAGFCPKDPVKKYLFRVIFFSIKSWTAPKDGYACDSWEECGVIVYPYQFYGQSIKQSSDSGHCTGVSVPERPCPLSGYSPGRKCADRQKYMKGHQNGRRPPTSQSRVLQGASEVP